MIEKEDIENTYNMMVCDSEQEEISEHINEMEKSTLQKTNLFSSPQFKD